MSSQERGKSPVSPDADTVSAATPRGEDIRRTSDEAQRAKAHQPNRFRPGDIVARRFVIVRFLGSGGMGEVYEAEDRFLQGTHIALKAIQPNSAALPGA